MYIYVYTVCAHLSVSIWYSSRNLLSRCQTACWTVFAKKTENTHNEYLTAPSLHKYLQQSKRYLPELCLWEISPFV